MERKTTYQGTRCDNHCLFPASCWLQCRQGYGTVVWASEAPKVGTICGSGFSLASWLSGRYHPELDSYR